MSCFRPFVARLFAIPRRIGSAAVVAILCLLPSVVHAENLTRVEEDWELVVGDPGPIGGLPQVTTTMSPVGDLSNVRWLLTLNLDGQPAYESGGIQLLAWQENVPGPAKRFGVGTRLHVDNEVITWTQVMAVERGVLYCAVVDGKSESWGNFGQGNSLTVSVPTKLKNLNDYSQSLSYFCSGVSGTRLAPTRVRSLTLRQVRWYSPEGLEYQDREAKLVY